MLYTSSIDLPTLQATQQLASSLLNSLNANSVLGLDGCLGAGKTTFTQALAVGLGINEPITSPTFTLLHRYEQGRLPLVHVDWYRLGGEPRQELLWELEELLDGGNHLVVMEWCCLVPEWAGAVLTHHLQLQTAQKNQSRTALLHTNTSASPTLKSSLAQALAPSAYGNFTQLLQTLQPTLTV